MTLYAWRGRSNSLSSLFNTLSVSLALYLTLYVYSFLVGDRTLYLTLFVYKGIVLVPGGAGGAGQSIYVLLPQPTQRRLSIHVHHLPPLSTGTPQLRTSMPPACGPPLKVHATQLFTKLQECTRKHAGTCYVAHQNTVSLRQPARRCERQPAMKGIAFHNTRS